LVSVADTTGCEDYAAARCNGALTHHTTIPGISVSSAPMLMPFIAGAHASRERTNLPPGTTWADAAVNLRRRGDRCRRQSSCGDRGYKQLPDHGTLHISSPLGAATPDPGIVSPIKIN